MNRVFTTAKDKIKQANLPDFRVGDVVRVHRRVKEGSKERVQIIEGEIIAHKHGFQPGGSITIRRVTLGVAVELVLPIHSPHTEKIQIVKRQKVRHAKLYHLRKTKGKKSKLKENIEGTKQIREMEELRKKEKEAQEKAEKHKEEQAVEKQDSNKTEEVENKPETKEENK